MYTCIYIGNIFIFLCHSDYVDIPLQKENLRKCTNEDQIRYAWDQSLILSRIWKGILYKYDYEYDNPRASDAYDVCAWFYFFVQNIFIYVYQSL